MLIIAHLNPYEELDPSFGLMYQVCVSVRKQECTFVEVEGG